MTKEFTTLEDLAHALNKMARQGQHGYGANVVESNLLEAIERAAAALELLTEANNDYQHENKITRGL